MTVNGDTETRFAKCWPQLKYSAQTNSVAVWPFYSKTWAESPIQETLNLKAVLIYQGKSMGSSAFLSTLENLDFCTHRISLISLNTAGIPLVTEEWLLAKLGINAACAAPALCMFCAYI